MFPNLGKNVDNQQNKTLHYVERHRQHSLQLFQHKQQFYQQLKYLSSHHSELLVNIIIIFSIQDVTSSSLTDEPQSIINNHLTPLQRSFQTESPKEFVSTEKRSRGRPRKHRLSTANTEATVTPKNALPSPSIRIETTKPLLGTYLSADIHTFFKCEIFRNKTLSNIQNI